MRLFVAPIGLFLVGLLASQVVDPAAQSASTPPVGVATPALVGAGTPGVPADCLQQALATRPAATPALADASPTAMLPTTVTIVVVDLAYRPCALTIPANTSVTVTLTNSGTAVGNFVIDELGVRTADIQPGETLQVQLNAPPGIYVFYSDIPGHRAAGQSGVLTVFDSRVPIAGTPPSESFATRKRALVFRTSHLALLVHGTGQKRVGDAHRSGDRQDESREMGVLLLAPAP